MSGVCDWCVCVMGVCEVWEVCVRCVRGRGV